MEAYKFETTVLENGMIRVPELEKYKNKHIEIFVIFKPEIYEDIPKISADEFLANWTGFAKGINAEDEKYNYLMEKYKW